MRKLLAQVKEHLKAKDNMNLTYSKLVNNLLKQACIDVLGQDYIAADAQKQEVAKNRR